MKKNNVFYKSLLRQANPLELRNPDFSSKCFPSLQSTYSYVIQQLYLNAQYGYVDLVFEIAELYYCTFAEAIELYNNWFKPLFDKRIFYVKLGESSSKSFYRNFIIALHKRTRTEFDPNQFRMAFEQFLKDLEYEKNNKIIKGNEKGTTTEGNPQ